MADIVTTIIDDEEPSVASTDAPSREPVEGVVYGSETTPAPVAKPEDVPSSPVQDEKPVDKFSFLNEIDTDELLNHPKLRAVTQSRKDREINERLATERATLEQQIRAQFQAELDSRAERSKIEAMDDEEYGSYQRDREAEQARQQAQDQRYQEHFQQNVAPQIYDQALQQMYTEGYKNLIEALGPESFQAVSEDVASGKLSAYSDVVKRIVETHAQKLAAPMAKQLAEQMYRGRVADENLSEEAPDVNSSPGRAQVPYLRYSDISRWTPEQAARNMDALDAAERSGRINYNE